jgi:hypothetical protein
MTSEQLQARNAAISAGQKRAWTDPVIRARRSAAIAKAQDDALHRALMRKVTEGSLRDEKGRYESRR